LSKPGLIIMARPDHGGWVEKVVRWAHRDSEILYITKPENIDVDLPGFKLKVVDAPECNCEQVFQVDRTKMPPARRHRDVSLEEIDELFAQLAR
jgi:hypothetical protein